MDAEWWIQPFVNISLFFSTPTLNVSCEVPQQDYPRGLDHHPLLPYRKVLKPSLQVGHLAPILMKIGPSFSCQPQNNCLEENPIPTSTTIKTNLFSVEANLHKEENHQKQKKQKQKKTKKKKKQKKKTTKKTTTKKHNTIHDNKK